MFEQIPAFDIFVGLFWKRMGTPTSTANSGTEAEFRLAYEIWQKNKTLPVLFYFCQQAFPPPRTLDEVEQLRRVVDFRAELSNKGLVADYAEHERFADVIRPHLLLVLGKLRSPHESAVETADRVAARASASENLAVHQQLAGLAQEYETLRATMDPGDTRTRRMEVLVTRMRALGLAGYPMLRELALSASPGQRLAGVTILQLVPKTQTISIGWQSDSGWKRLSSATMRLLRCSPRCERYAFHMSTSCQRPSRARRRVWKRRLAARGRGTRTATVFSLRPSRSWNTPRIGRRARHSAGSIDAS